MTTSKIEWTDRSDWNPIRGCTRVSPGCGGPGKQGGCYAEGMAARFSKLGQWGHGFAEMRNGEPRWTGKIEMQEDRVTLPLSWRKPARIFVSSTSDVFHEALSDEEIDKLFAVMGACEDQNLGHEFQILTKRPGRMLAYVMSRAAKSWNLRRLGPNAFPPRNVWLGVSAEDQQRADERIPLLLQTPAAVRFVSLEPLLGPIDLRCIPFTSGDPRHKCDALTGQALMYAKGVSGHPDCVIRMKQPCTTSLDWVIVGGESGPHARPMHPDWARSLRDQSASADVPFFFKQWGQFVPMIVPDWPESPDKVNYYNPTMKSVGKRAAARLLDGIEHNGMPTLAA